MADSMVVFLSIGLLLCLFIGALLGRALLRRTKRTTFLHRMQTACTAEEQAENLLATHGFKLIQRQVRVTWPLWVNGQEVLCESRADAIVERQGIRFVAEIKSGAQAPLASHPATRRQLLEYSLLFHCHEVLLVNVSDWTIAHIRFDALLE